MRLATKCILTVVLLATLGAVVGAVLIVRRGFSTRDQPWAIEAAIARYARRLAMPRGAMEAKNPIAATPEVLTEARAHFADHCAICHANDGSGNTEIGRNLYPKAPDMRQPATQSLSDGELFYIIHNGIRLTGMPAWGSGSPEDDQDGWKLVHFIRGLPHLTAEELEEMEMMNPKSRRELQEEEEIRKFLDGGDARIEKHHH